MTRNNVLTIVMLILIVGGAGLRLSASPQVPELPEDPMARGIALIEQGRFSEAQAIFEGLLQVEPVHKEAMYFRGVARLGLDDPDRAWSDFSRLLQIDPNYAMGLVGQAQVLAKRAQYAESLAAVEGALALEPLNSEAHYQKGIVLGWQKQIDAALNSFLKCLEINPTHARAHYQVGLVYSQLKRKDLAIYHLEMFLKLAPLAQEAEQVRNLLNNLRR